SNCLRLLTHLMRLADSLAWDRAGNSILARTPMMAMTTSNSMSVNAALRDCVIPPMSQWFSGRAVSETGNSPFIFIQFFRTDSILYDTARRAHISSIAYPAAFSNLLIEYFMASGVKSFMHL